DTMEEGVLVAWLAEEGDAVSAGDVIAQVETDKATMDLEVYDDGVLLKRVIGEGDAVPIGGLIAVLGKEGEDASQILAKYSTGGDGAAQDVEPEAAPTQDAGGAEASSQDERTPSVASGDGAAKEAQPAQSGDGRIKASPLARKLAGDHGIDLSSVEGTGPEGRIVKRDIEALMGGDAKAVPQQQEQSAPSTAREQAISRPAQPQPATSDSGGYDAVRISQMRKAIARRLAQSKYTAPHFYLTIDVDMERAIATRKQLNERAEAQGRAKVSFNDLITKSCAVALRQHPSVNASYMEEEGEIRQHHAAHIGVAVAIGEGLVTPVIRNADQKGLTQIAEETRALAEKARDRKLQPDEMEGSTFTTSNLGMFGIEEFTAIINPPNACILAIGAIRDEPVVKEGAVVPGKRMKVTLSCDHRVVDGATGAQFLATLQQYLEDPMLLLL
ncbi:MAG: pyruvate dehydrogenase complex dihydrolipoamide acetyltransferase, partial [Saprospiraceae bacterium]|nr:pyruvate dehydrogenase complex dihydrolipoamide acetyltransferase [Saprospiraceae bacterium]